MTYFLSHKYVLVINFIMISLAVCIIFPYFLGDLITLDMMYQGYNLNEVKHALESYGSQGRLRYFFISRYFDHTHACSDRFTQKIFVSAYVFYVHCFISMETLFRAWSKSGLRFWVYRTRIKPELT